MRLIVDEYTDCTRGERKLTLVHRSEETGETLLLLADASAAAFSRRYQPLIDVVKTRFIDSLLNGEGSLQERLRSAPHAIEGTMRERFISSTEFGEECYSTVFVALGLKEWTAFPSWIGSPQAKLLRSGLCTSATSPHVLTIPNVEMIFTENSISTYNQTKASVSEAEPWPLEANDMLVLADHRLFALFSENDLANVIEGASSNKAKALVEAAQALNFTFAQSAIVAQVL